jgi:hypothetical protein
MKTIFIGDIHGRDIWKKIVESEKADRVLFIGDYFDSFDIGSAEQQYNFKEIIEFKEKGECEVIMLIGNHDFHYINTYEVYSGFQRSAGPAIQLLIKENLHHFQMCYEMDNILCSHAGIGYDWLVNQNRYKEGEPISNFVNEIWKYKPRNFEFNGIFDPTGDDIMQTPIWIRPRSLMSGNKNTFLNDQYIQVVGHTEVKEIPMKLMLENKLFLIDALPVGNYLIYEENYFMIGVVNG